MGSRDAAWDPRNVSLLCARLWLPAPNVLPWRRSSSSSSIHHPNLVMVASRHPTTKLPSWDQPRRIVSRPPQLPKLKSIVVFTLGTIHLAPDRKASCQGPRSSQSLSRLLYLRLVQYTWL